MARRLSGIGVLHNYPTSKFSKNSAKMHAEENIFSKNLETSTRNWLTPTMKLLFTNQQTFGNFLIYESAVAQRITRPGKCSMGKCT